jgi:predicted DNA-binding transcriptional regulator YafY
MKWEKRLKIIDKLLYSKKIETSIFSIRNYFLETEDYDYRKRTFDRDIERLKNLIHNSFPGLEEKGYDSILYIDRSTGVYSYRIEGFSAYAELSSRELVDLTDWLHKKGLVASSELDKGIIQKLKAINTLHNLNKYQSHIKWSPISFQTTIVKNGENLLSQILEFIIKETVINFQKINMATGEMSWYSGLPLIIREYNNGCYSGWYLLLYEVDYCQRKIELNKSSLTKLRCIALDRISNIAVSNVPFIKVIKDDFRPSEYFDNIIGITRLNLESDFKGIESVVLEIEQKSWLLPYFKRYKVHSSQSIEYSRDVVRLTLDLEISIELVNFIFTYLDEIKVLEPDVLKEYLKNKLSKATKRLI